MRVMLPHPADAVDVHEFYAEGWLDRGGVRVNFVSSVDGAAHASGKSEGLQTPGDNLVFAALRDLADVVLVGSGTVLAEGYRAVHLSDERRAARRRHGMPDVLPIAVTSRSLHLDAASSLFTDAAPGARTIVLTCAAAPDDARRALAEVADVVVCGEDDVDPVLVRAALQDRGLTRILSEGGPTAFAQLTAGGAVDELCLSRSPLLIGPGPGRITAGEGEWADPTRLRLTGLLEDDDALFLRYAVVR